MTILGILLIIIITVYLIQINFFTDWKKFCRENVRMNYGNNKHKATEVNHIIETYFKDEKICKICKNFVVENLSVLPNIVNLELSFVPYIYSDDKKDFLNTKIKTKNEESISLYEKIIKNYTKAYFHDNKINAAKIFCIRNGYYTGFDAMITFVDKSYNNRFEGIKSSKLQKLIDNEKESEKTLSSGFEIIKNLYDILIKQHLIIDLDENINYYHAFLFLIYYYMLESINSSIVSDMKNLQVDLNNSDFEIFNFLYNKNCDSLTISAILTYKSIIESDNTKTFSFENLKYNKYVKEQTQIMNENKKISDLLNDNLKQNVKVRIEEIDLMNGEEFEYFITQLFNTMGYKATHTKLSGDQGVDVIAEKDNIKIVIQTKCYHNVVGNKAIQEAVAGMKYYDANKAMVITNSTFTKSAIELAQKNNVQLWDRKTLIEKINEIL